MKAILKCAVSAFACCLQLVLVVSGRGQPPRTESAEATRPAKTTPSGKAGGTWIPALTGERRPLCRLRNMDSLEIDFTFAPAFDQSAGALPDALPRGKTLPDLVGQDASVPELRDAIRSADAATPHTPDLSIVLEDSDQPSFMVSGQVMRPGTYEWRADTTVDQAIALAGGRTDQARTSRVLLFRRRSERRMEVCFVNVKYSMNSRSLRQEHHLEPGDLIFVPQNWLAELGGSLPTSRLCPYRTRGAGSRVRFRRETAPLAEGRLACPSN